MTSWLVTGATGLLGSNAARVLGELGEVTCSSRSAPAESDFTFLTADLADEKSRKDLVAKAGAEAVLHAAAVASIEACEADPELAHRINVEAAVDLADQARRVGSAFVYISTDAVFDGTLGAYDEDSPTSPASEYGRSKVRGERAVLDANPDALIARVNFYGWSPTGTRSLAEFFYYRLLRGEPTPGFSDITVSTMQVSYLVDALSSLVAARASGVLHVASSESISKYEFGRKVAAEFGFDSTLVRARESSGYLQHKRGSNLSLSTERARQILGVRLAGQDQGLKRLHQELDEDVPTAISRFETGKRQ